MASIKDFRLSAKSFIVDGNSVLLLKRSDDNVQSPGIWEPPGGRLELGENPKKGLIRETKEETGLDIEVLHPISVKHFERADNQTITMMTFLCRALSKEVKLSAEHSGFQWVQLDRCKDTITDFFHEEIESVKKLSRPSLD